MGLSNRSSFVVSLLSASAVTAALLCPPVHAADDALPPGHPPVPAPEAKEGGAGESGGGGGFIDVNFAADDLVVLSDSEVIVNGAGAVSFTATQPGGLARAAYLGVSTSSPDTALQKQLQLKPGVGLVVDSVEPGSPAEQAGVRQYDVLHKLDDQLLVNTDQLSVLVRSYDAGKEVKLSVIREGKPESLTTKLAERAVAPLRLALRRPTALSGVTFQRTPHTLVAVDAVNRVDPSNPFTFENGNVMIRTPDGKSQLSAALVTIDDGKRKITIASPGGRKHLKVEDKSGKMLFDGPIETKEDVEKVPADVRKFYEMILRDYSAAAATPTTTTKTVPPQPAATPTPTPAR
jgi:hypothetical protein